MLRSLKAIHIIFLATVIPVCASCSNPVNLTIQEYRIEEVRPTGLGSVHGTVGLEIVNGGAVWDVLSVNGTLYQGTMPLGNFTVAPFTIEKGEKWVSVGGDISIADNVSLMTILAMAGNFSLDNYNISVEAKLKNGMFITNVKKDNIPLNKLIRRL